MITDLCVIGTSLASGVGSGRELEDGKRNNNDAAASWVTHLAELCGARNVWNHSLPGKPIGLVNADGVEFGRQYLKKYGTTRNLFMILEYSLPSYRHWDPVAAARNDCMGLQIHPITYFAPWRNYDNEFNFDGYFQKGDNKLRCEFWVRKPIDMLEYHSAPEEAYDQIEEDAISQKDLNAVKQEINNWFEPEEHNQLRYLKYAYDELRAAQTYMTNLSAPYVQSWVGGISDNYKRAVDRYMKSISGHHRLIPMQEFTGITAAKEWSVKSWRNHPDMFGHMKIAEFYYDWIKRHKLWKQPSKDIWDGIS